MLCSTFCHLRVSHRFEVELAARRFGTNFHVGSTLGGLYPLSSPIFCVSVMPRQKPTDANLQEVLPHTWDTNRDKKQICESVSLREKKEKRRRLADSQTCSLQIWKSGTLYSPWPLPPLYKHPRAGIRSPQPFDSSGWLIFGHHVDTPRANPPCQYMSVPMRFYVPRTASEPLPAVDPRLIRNAFSAQLNCLAISTMTLCLTGKITSMSTDSISPTLASNCFIARRVCRSTTLPPPLIQLGTTVSTWETGANRRTSWIFSKLSHKSFERQTEILIPGRCDCPTGELW